LQHIYKKEISSINSFHFLRKQKKTNKKKQKQTNRTQKYKAKKKTKNNRAQIKKNICLIQKEKKQ
jgi:hypothetical protein